MPSTLSDKRGFTLLELLVVVAIVGILAAIAIQQFGAYRKRGFDADVRSNIKNLATAQEAYWVRFRTYGAGPGNSPQFASMGFRQSANVTITAAGTNTTFLITATALSGCSTGTGAWMFDSSTGMISGVPCG
jgi:type IV pilus assembly protein PilA